MTLAHRLREHAARAPHAEAIVAAGRRTDYARFDAAVDRVASWLLGLGVCRGDRVAVWLSNREEYLFTYLGCLRIGAVLVPLNTRLSPGEVEYMLAQSGACVIVFEDGFDESQRGEVIARLRRLLAPPGVVVRLEEREPLEDGEPCLDFSELAADTDGEALAAADGALAEDDPALIIYTSGSTGRPKGATLTSRGLMRYAACAARAGLFVADDRVLIHVPLSTAGGSVIQVAPVLELGATLILLDAFKGDASLELVETERVTCYVAPPTMLTLQLEAQNFESVDLSSLRHVITGAAPVPTALAERVIDSMGVRLTNSYGATETGGLVTYIPADAPAMAATETCGVAMPGYELRAVDAERHEVAPGEVGELAVRGPSVMAGYHDAPEQTAATLDDEGWWYSGDLATLDGDGYLRIVGRQKDMYIRGGYNVYPAEVEAVLETHEAVVSAAVVAYADPVLGERGRAFLVTRGGACDADEVRKHCRDHLADYKIPDDVRFVDELPLIGPGKVDRAALAALGETP